MNSLIFSVIMILFISSEIFTQSKQPHFYINSFLTCDTSLTQSLNQKINFLQEHLAIKLSEVYKCASITTKFEVVSTLKNLREASYLGANIDERLSDVAKSTVSDYLVAINAKVTGQTAIVRVLCMDPKTVKTLANAFISLPYNNMEVSTYEKISNDIINGLKTYEICPFKGEITVKVIGTKKDKQTEEYSVYCNGVDGMYHKTTTIDNYSESDWTVRKVGKETASGSVQFNLSQELTIDEINPCYECNPTKQGQRTYYEKTTTYADIQKSSTSGDDLGIILDSARVILNFLDDGTYTVRIKATSKQGEKKTIREVKAMGVCDNSNESPKKTINKIDEGLYELLGPFTGTAQDKVLSQKNTITKTTESGEEQTIAYEFNLTRE